MVVIGPAARDDREAVVGRPRFLADAVLGSYSQILFNRNHAVGILLVAATMVSPVAGCFGLGAVLLSLLVARLFKFSPDSIRAGLFGYNALLVGLGLGALYAPSAALVGLLVVGTVVVVVATATLNAALGATFNLPSLTLPFLFVFYLLLAVAPQVAGIESRPFEYDAFLQGETLPHALASYLKSLGAVFFLPRIDAGAVVLAALVFYSRIGFILSLLGFAVAYPLSLFLVAVPDAPLHLMMGYNLVLVAVALGGVWFVPRPSSFAFATVAVLVSAVLTLGSRSILQNMGLPLLILPFNLTVIPMLYAMRLRIRDGGPKAVDFWMGTPEENLNYFQTRMARFGYLYYIRFSLPVLGRWVCTQGNNGEHTHKGHWRHGLDFEVADADGRLHKGSGSRVEDYHCWRLPVLAAADGTVVKVVSTVADNKVGEVNTKENWGNLVLIYHGPGLYSLVAHLAAGSVKVKEGEVVRRGEQVGLCGNSGRSPVPHVHFQLQGMDRVGAPTIEAAFHEIVAVEPDRERLHATHLPEKGEIVRNLSREADLARLFEFPIGADFRLVLAGSGMVETIETRLDLYGSLMLESRDKRGTLFFENKHSTFTVYDYQGPPSSALYLLHAAVPRVPFDGARALEWSDHLVSRHFYPWTLRVLRDFVSPFLGLGGVQVDYRMVRESGDIVVLGESRTRDAKGRPLLRTRAVARPGRGLVEVEVTLIEKSRRAVRREEHGAADGTGNAA